MRVKADSTITIPVPEGQKSFSLSIKVPPKIQPMTQKDDRLKIESRKRSRIIWNADPSPKLQNDDEFLTVMGTFNKKGWVKSRAAQAIARMRPMDKYRGIRLLQHVTNNVLELAHSTNLTRTIRKANLEATDIEDLRRMINRFSSNLRTFGSNPDRYERDLLLLQERFATARQGILKVIRVEEAEDGETLIHLRLD